MHDRRGFRLSKWYLDCVAPGGDTVVAYVAELGWGRIALRYASVLQHARGRSRVTTSLRSPASPSSRGGAIAWSSRALAVRGTWQGMVPPHERTLLASQDGSVEWRCLHPAARVELRLGGGTGTARDVGGLGYAEHLTTTIPPWRMPIRELHWGRFVSVPDDHGRHASIVWTDWRGPHEVRIVLRDGAPIRADVTEDRLTLDDGSVLALDRRDVLREGTLGATVLAAIPRLRDTVPGPILGVHERKWRSRGVLTRAGRRALEGWAIHEVVRWP
jgi:hypothetical protein